MPRILFAVTCALLLVSTLAGAVEVPLTNIHAEPAPYSRGGAVIAATDQKTVVAWLDRRFANGDFGVYLQWIDRDGNPVAENVLIDRSPSITGLALATDGTDFLLAWTPYDRQTFSYQTKVMRISAAGDLKQMPSFDGGTIAGMRSIGRYYVVTYRGPLGLYYVVLDHDGNVSNTGVLMAQRDAGVRVTPLSGDSLMVSWMPDHEGKPRTVVMTVSQLLGFFAPFQDLTEPVGYINHEAATNGRNVLVVWNVTQPTGAHRYFSQVFGLDGVPLSEPQFLVEGSIESNFLKVIWDGQQYQLAYSNFGRPTLLRVSESGQPVGTPSALFDGFGTVLDWTMTPSGVVAAIDASDSYGSENSEIYSQMIPAAGGPAVASRVLLSRSFPDQHSPVIARCEDGTIAVVWVETVSGDDSVVYQDLAHTATSPPVVFQRTHQMKSVPSVACGEETLVASGTYGGNYSAFVAALDRPTGLVTTTTLQSAAPDSETNVVWNGLDFVVLWQYSDHSLVATRLDSHGRGGGSIPLMPPHFDLNGHALGESAPFAVWSGSQYCVYWQTESNVGISSLVIAHRIETTVVGPFLTRSASPVAPPGLLDSLDATPPVAIADGGDCVAAWGQAPIVYSGAWGPYELVTASVDANGVFTRGVTPLGVMGRGVRPAATRWKGQTVFGFGNRVVTLQGTTVVTLREYSGDAEVDAVAARGDDLIVLLTRPTADGQRRIFVDGLPPARRRAVPHF